MYILDLRALNSTRSFHDEIDIQHDRLGRLGYLALLGTYVASRLFNCCSRLTLDLRFTTYHDSHRELSTMNGIRSHLSLKRMRDIAVDEKSGVGM
jgi:hypothetical protein